MYSKLWKYNILSNEILIKCLLLKPWNKWGRLSLKEYIFKPPETLKFQVSQTWNFYIPADFKQ